jgi:hypothetical protein
MEAGYAPLAGVPGWGLVGGLVGTMAMGVCLTRALAAAGCPASLCVSIVGDTVSFFFSLFGKQIAGGVSAGAVMPAIVGPFVGILIAAAAAALSARREATLKKNAAAAVVCVEILSQPLLATTPILLKMPPAVTLLRDGRGPSLCI